VGDYIYEAKNGDYGDGRSIDRVALPLREISSLYDYRVRPTPNIPTGFSWRAQGFDDAGSICFVPFGPRLDEFAQAYGLVPCLG
jgi:hypothetical protein